MNTDFRVSVDFFNHHKTRKLKKRIGNGGVLSLMQLWAYAAKVRPLGDLYDMSEEDIEMSADWQGEEGVFISACVDVGFIDSTESGFVLHDWVENNPWVAESEARSEKARKAAKARWGNADASSEQKGKDAKNMPKQCTSNADASSEQCPYPIPSYPEELRENANTFLSEPPTDGTVADQCAVGSEAQDAAGQDDSPTLTAKNAGRGNAEENLQDKEPRSQSAKGRGTGGAERKQDNCPQQRIVELYHEVLPSLAKVRIWRDNKAAQLRARWREKEKEGKFHDLQSGLTYFRKFFEYVAQSEFLMGRVEQRNREPFVADLAWLIKANNFDKVLQGKYHKREAA